MKSVIFIRKPKTLTLVLKKQWFDLMVTGEKDKEFREPTDWIKSRLYNKDGSTKEYDYIKFINGYQANAPYFICKYEGFGTGYDNTYTFKSNPSILLKVTPEQYVIFLGEIIERGNLKNKQ